MTDMQEKSIWKNEIIAVMPVVTGNGAKYVTTRLAKEIAKNYDDEEQKVLLIDFDFENPYLAEELIDEENVTTIDDLFPLLTDDLKSNMALIEEYKMETMIESVDLLKGTQFAGLTKHLSPMQIRLTLEAAKAMYQHVVVVIAPSAGNVATIHTLIQCDKLVLIARQNRTNRGKLPSTIKMLRQYYTSDEFIRLIYNYDTAVNDVDMNEMIESSFLPIRVVTALVFDEKSVDDKDLIKETGFFQAKPLNNKAIIKLFEDLIEEEE